MDNTQPEDDWDDWEDEADAASFQSWKQGTNASTSTSASASVSVSASASAYSSDDDDTQEQKTKKTPKHMVVANFILEHYDEAIKDNIKPSQVKARGGIPIKLNKQCYDSKFSHIGELMSKIHTVITRGKISNDEQRKMSDLTKTRDEADGLIKTAESQAVLLQSKLELMRKQSSKGDKSSLAAQTELSRQISLIMVLTQSKHGEITDLEKQISEIEQRINDKKGGRNSNVNKQYINARKYMNQSGENTFRVIQVLTQTIYPEADIIEPYQASERGGRGDDRSDYKRRDTYGQSSPYTSRADEDGEWRRGSTSRDASRGDSRHGPSSTYTKRESTGRDEDGEWRRGGVRDTSRRDTSRGDTGTAYQTKREPNGREPNGCDEDGEWRRVGARGDTRRDEPRGADMTTPWRRESAQHSPRPPRRDDSRDTPRGGADMTTPWRRESAPRGPRAPKDDSWQRGAQSDSPDHGRGKPSDDGSGKVFEQRFERQQTKSKTPPKGKSVYVPPNRRYMGDDTDDNVL